MGQGEDNVEVVGVEEIALLDLKPPLASLRLHFEQQRDRHELVREGCFVRTLTRIPMPAKGSSAATFDGPISLQPLIAENGLKRWRNCSALATDDVGHFDGRRGPRTR